MKVAVLVFPGSNSDHDAYHAVKHVCGHPARFVWHKEGSLGDADAVIVPGGFSYGDYLRSGAIARFAPVMAAVAGFAARGGPVLGICNGFQILQEAGLLPGAMLRNRGVRFLSRQVQVRVERSDTAATAGLPPGTVLSLPIAHGEGNFHADPDELDRLEGEGQVVFRYVEPVGFRRRGEPGAGPMGAPSQQLLRPQTPDDSLSEAANPNGSARAIAGVCNQGRNVVGLMPHPERAAEPHLHHGGEGRRLLESWLSGGWRRE